MRAVTKSRGQEVKYALAIDFKGRMPRLWCCIALALVLGLLAGCTGGGGSKSGKSVLKTRQGETGIQVTESEEDEVEKNIGAGIEKIRRFQAVASGGFVYWPSQGAQPHPWATNYVGHFLLEAEKKGYFVFFWGGKFLTFLFHTL